MVLRKKQRKNRKKPTERGQAPERKHDDDDAGEAYDIDYYWLNNSWLYLNLTNDSFESSTLEICSSTLLLFDV